MIKIKGEKKRERKRGGGGAWSIEVFNYTIGQKTILYSLLQLFTLLIPPAVQCISR